MKVPTNDKIEALLNTARFVAQISRPDAEAIFQQAHRITEEVNIDDTNKLLALSSLAAAAAVGMQAGERRTVARDFHTTIHDAAIRLGHDDFPWRGAIGALATLDFPVALAAISRWQDMDRLDLQASLAPTLVAALGTRVIDARHATCLMPLLHSVPIDLIQAINRNLEATQPSFTSSVIEQLAKDELMRFGCRADCLEILKRTVQSGSETGRWLKSLTATVEFLRGQKEVPLTAEGDHRVDTSRVPSLRGRFAGRRFVSAEVIARTLSEEREEARASSTYTPTEAIFEAIRESVPVGDRVAHLNALVSLRKADIGDGWLADAVLDALKRWESPGIRQWRQQSLAAMIVERLPGLAGWSSLSGNPTLRNLLPLLPEPTQTAPKVLVEAISQNVSNFSARQVYEIIPALAEWLKAEDVGRALASHLERLVRRISPSQTDQIDLNDVPLDPLIATARFLFSLMSDVDLRIRWRAAHSVRRLALFGMAEPLGALFELYDRTDDASYREPKMPFYWLAARLWFVIAMDRIANETPATISKHARRLLQIATDGALPHVLLRAFAKDAAIELEKAGILHLSPAERNSLFKANAGRFGNRRSSVPWGGRRQEIGARKYKFDQLDTVPYLYEPRLGMFAELTLNQFLDIAEIWIVQSWKAPADLSHWDREPRKSRFSRHTRGLFYASHGAEPTWERYSTHLEWHAMFCTIGELMRTHTLVKSSEYSCGTFQSWLHDRQLAFPPFWLADMRGPKPLDGRFWFEPSEATTSWGSSMSDSDFYGELFPKERPGMITVRTHHDTGSSGFRSTFDVSTALVQSETAGALMRALDSTEDPWDYKLPDESDESFEIIDPPYRLLGWLSVSHRESGIDRKDPLRNSVDAVPYEPGSISSKRLAKTISFDGRVVWSRANGKAEFECESWSDHRNDVPDETLGSEVESDGARLLAYPEAIRVRLHGTGLDLIAKVTLSREKGQRGQTSSESEKARGVRRAKVFLLRADGTVETTDGPVGTW